MSTSPSAVARSSGSAPPVTGPFQRRAAKVISQAALYQLVEEMARGLDGVRQEMAAQTEQMDQLCRMVREIAEHVGAPAE